MSFGATTHAKAGLLLRLFLALCALTLFLSLSLSPPLSFCLCALTDLPSVSKLSLALLIGLLAAAVRLSLGVGIRAE
jgi:hypothetical protein